MPLRQRLTRRHLAAAASLRRLSEFSLVTPPFSRSDQKRSCFKVVPVRGRGQILIRSGSRSVSAISSAESGMASVAGSPSAGTIDRETILIPSSASSA